jgi:hypothetical protein
MSNGWGVTFGQGAMEKAVVETTVDLKKHFQLQNVCFVCPFFPSNILLPFPPGSIIQPALPSSTFDHLLLAQPNAAPGITTNLY